MKYLKNNTNRNDVVMTPEYVAKALIEHFKPEGKILEPCKGSGNFLKYLPSNSLWCEITEGKDFMEFNEKVDWIITNPPWSKIRPFIQKSLEVSDNFVFLTTIVHLWMKARLRDIHQAGFGIKEIILLSTPKNFPQSGFQLGAFHIQKGYSGSIKFSNLSGISETLLSQPAEAGDLISIKRVSDETPNLLTQTSLNADIMFNKLKMLQSDSKWKSI